jgi:hypothetical protein
MKIISAIFEMFKCNGKIHINQRDNEIIFKFGCYCSDMEYAYNTRDETYCKRGDFKGGYYFRYTSFPRDMPLYEYFKNKVLDNTIPYTMTLVLKGEQDGKQ